MTRILGIDPSLTGTGLALLDTDDHLVIPTYTLTSKGAKGATLDERRMRIARIAERHVGDHALGVTGDHERVELAVIEAPAFSRNNSGTWDRAGLWWMIVHRLAVLGVPVIEVPPTTRAKYATGRGNASKDEVLLAVAKRYPHVGIENNNEADSLVLAAIGAHLVGHPIDEVPKSHLDALAKLPRHDLGDTS